MNPLSGFRLGTMMKIISAKGPQFVTQGTNLQKQIPSSQEDQDESDFMKGQSMAQKCGKQPNAHNAIHQPLDTADHSLVLPNGPPEGVRICG